MSRHEQYLKTIVMVTNVAKTERIMFSRKPIRDPITIVVNGIEIKPKQTVKVVGLTFDENLGWAPHIEKVKQKARYLLFKMKFWRKYLQESDMKKVITTHFYGMIYYAAPIWFNELTSSVSWHILNILH